MLVAFKIPAESQPKSAVDRLISWWTRSPITHCELVFEERGFTCVAARIDPAGVFPLPPTQVLAGPTQWLYYRLAGVDEARAWAFVATQFSRPYNYSGLFQGQIPALLGPARPGAWFCSELVWEVMNRFAPFDLPSVDPAAVSPAEIQSFFARINQQPVTISLAS